MTHIIQPIKIYNRMTPNPTKDEILEWANQDDNLTWAKGYPLIKKVTRTHSPISSPSPQHYKVFKRKK